ncbi:MAG: tetratricopeptide repeat protein [Alphaproteobacteria bacterium]|nr:tetratricopeptide repeat protein [Alphaproteobacteria bacterium]
MKKFRTVFLSLLVALVTVSLNACSTAAESSKKDDIFVMQAEPVPPGDTLAGNYLAGRFAQRQEDWNAAQDYMNAVMEFDKGNHLLRQRAFLLSIGAREYPRAKELATRLAAQKDGNELALIYLASDAMNDGDYQAALDDIAKLPQDGFGQYTKPLMSAWAYVGLGKSDKALEVLRGGANPADPTYNMHAGLVAEFAGDKEAAAAYYKIAMSNGLTLHSALVIANFFERNGKPSIARRIFDGLGKMYPFNPFMGAVGARPAEQMPHNITRPADGAAIALYDLATLLYERRAYDSAQIYGSMSLLMSPHDPFTQMMMGDVAAVNGKYPASVKDYEAVTPASPLYWLSRLRMAEIYEAADHAEKAEALLQELAAQPATRIEALVSLGDLYRRHEKYAEAVQTYDAVLKNVSPVTVEYWPVIYARGMAQERLDKWPLAEKDLLAALALQPDNPMILNFIGYSWANKGMHLEKALDYLRRAVAQRPDDGYILDSYGWALYRNAQYKDAALWLEKAVSYVPDDSTILDHLGDAYWQAGRKTEARYKWRRAQELSKDESFRAAVARKLANGVDPAPAKVAHKDNSL